MASKTTVLVSAIGTDGFPGALAWDDANQYQAPTGAHGRHGRDSPFPAPGAPGGRLDVMMGFNPDRPGLVQMMGEGSLAGARWEVGDDAEFLLSVRGGNGGAGGFGEIGQAGGDGYNGQDATKRSRGGDGGPGADGGNGGRGTNGGNGGPGGIVHINVHEDDLDTLIGVKWDVLGGRGGPLGVHGFAGDGGDGGRGGDSYSWTESVAYEAQYNVEGHVGSRTEYRDETRRMAGGSGGRGGDAGMRPVDPLFPGQDGSPGAGQVTVTHADGSTGMYASRYMLVVTSFSVQDENEDGINEPGEHLIVSDVVVTNTGACPSPGAGRLHILINSTEWLEPVIIPLQVPGGILPGQSVDVPGVLKALIKNETKPRQLGTLLNAQDTVSLRAFSPRLQRDVPEFPGQLAVPVTYKYPLLMTTPRSLDCVAKGDTVTFSWTVQNISTKAHGQTGNRASTHLSDPGGMFDLKRADPDTPHQILDAIGVLQPGEKRPITVEFQVSELAEDFSTGSMLIKLLIADPGNPEMFRAAVSFDLRIQISPSYRYNPSARFLLVINAQSPNAFVLHILNFIQHGLRLAVDVFNLSLTGSFTAPPDESRGGAESAVLTNYAGKSVIILGNTMNYFQAGTREPWELLDAAETFALARQGTGFLVVSPTNMASLQAFVEILSISGVSLPSTGTANNDCTDVKDAIQKLARTTEPATFTVPIKKTVLRNLEKTMTKRAHAAGHELGRAFPLRRFFVGRGADPVAVGIVDAAAPVEDDSDDIYNAEDASSKPKKKSKKPPKPKAPKQQKGGVLDIIEGLPHDTKLVAALQEMYSGSLSAGVSNYIVAMLVHALPFEDQCEMFWNLVGMSAMEGVEIGRDDVAVGVVYGGEKLEHLIRSGGSGRGHQLVHGKACEAVSWSIATQLASELTHFCAAGGGGGSSSLLAQLPLLSQFISSSTSRPSLSSTTSPSNNSSTTILINLLAHLTSVTSPLSFGQRFGQNMTGAGKRRKKVRNMLISDISEPLLAKIKSPAPVANIEHDNPDAANNKKIKKSTTPTLAQTLADSETTIKKHLTDLRKNNPHLDRVARAHELSCTILSQLTTKPGARFIDLINGTTTPSVNSKGTRTTTKVVGRDDYVKLKLRQTQRTSNLANDVAFSSERLRNMVTKTSEPVTPVSPVVVQLEEDLSRLLLEAGKPVVFVREERVVGELVSI